MITNELPAPTPPPELDTIQSLEPPIHSLRSSLSTDTMASLDISSVEMSQPVRRPPRQRKRAPTMEESFQDMSQFTYQAFLKNPVDLGKFKVPQLKRIAAYHRLYVSGKKAVLVDRILNFFHINVCAVQIQKVMRRFFVRRLLQLRGAAFRNRAICVNQTDFYTLEPLDEISNEEFFSYTDDSNFTYGFNLLSLVSLLKRKGRGTANPYNRARIPEAVIGNVIRLYWYVAIFHEDVISTEDREESCMNQYMEPVKLSPFIRGFYYGFPAKPRKPTVPFPTRSGNRLETDLARPLEPTPPFNGDGIPDSPENTVISAPTTNTAIVNIDLQVRHMQAMRRKMNELSMRSYQERATELFMEIDLLGNYTNVSWFTDLSTNQLFQYYFQLNDIWRYQGQLSAQMKQRLSPLADPFHNIYQVRRNTFNWHREDILRECLYVMELLIFTAYDVEDRKISTMLVLMGLVRVSLPARQAMFWLYE
jgi:SAP domain